MDAPIPEPSLYTVRAILILDNDGNRLVAKYYDDTYPTVKDQKAFEKNLFNKTHRANAEIIMLEGLTCVYRSNVDLFFYVIGSAQENELILVSVLNCYYDAVSQMLKKNVEKRALLDNLDGVFLALDEVCDNGIIMESDPTAIVNRVSFRADDIPLGEQTVAQVVIRWLNKEVSHPEPLYAMTFSPQDPTAVQVLQSAKEQIKWSLLK